MDLRYDADDFAFQNSSVRLDSVDLDDARHGGDKVSQTGFGATALNPGGVSADAFRIAWVDGDRLTRECMMNAFAELSPQLVMFPFNSIRECLEGAREDVDLIIYHSHELDADCLDSVTAMVQVYEGMPVIVLLDDDEVHQIDAIPDAMKSGVRGFISTRTADISMALAAMRFVKAGGTFAPRDLLMTKRAAPSAQTAPAAPNQLTPRQTAVFSELRQGKANKIIAHELGMSESTVKIHVRNIMRKMGATNRTQAVFKARSIGLDAGYLQSAAM